MPKCICFSICLFFRSIFHMFFYLAISFGSTVFLAIFRWFFCHLRFPVINIYLIQLVFFCSVFPLRCNENIVLSALRDICMICPYVTFFMCVCVWFRVPDENFGAEWHNIARYSSEYIFFSLFLFVLNWINYVVWIFNHVLFESVIIHF